jgi:glycosyltransferase involved in cell wall biosynthesis
MELLILPINITTMKNIIVTLTTVPSRLASEDEQGIKLCINSLVSQSYENYEIHFNIPFISKVTGEKYEVPQWLTEIEKVQIFRTDDLGPITKLAHTVERIADPDTIIIVVDDDLVYHTDMVAEQVNNQIKWEDAIVGYDGMRSRNDEGAFSNYFGDVRDYYYTSNYRSCRVDILQHYKSISYKRKYFEDDFFTFIQENNHWEDDIVLAAYFAHKRRDRIATFHESDEKFNSLEEWSLRGGVSSFPVLRHTHHEHLEGCNLLRQAQPTHGNNLYKYIDFGYIK